jgi:redox-sensitive bicupin YhaK (pirin superfamily)
MKIELHKNEDRGVGEHEWLSTRYSFSFNDWYNPLKMGFGALRVLNDDIIAPHSGFGAHSHRDMEIITVVMKGTVTHKDSLGNVGHIKEGMIQVMSAGTGVTHSEYNEGDVPLELFQIWIMTKERGITPRYEEKHIDFLKSEDARVLLVGDGGLSINQDVSILYVSSTAEEEATYMLHGPERGVYFFVIEGEVKVGEATARRRDALCISEIEEFSYSVKGGTKVLLIEIPL